MDLKSFFIVLKCRKSERATDKEEEEEETIHRDIMTVQNAKQLLGKRCALTDDDDISCFSCSNYIPAQTHTHTR